MRLSTTEQGQSAIIGLDCRASLVVYTHKLWKMSYVNGVKLSDWMVVTVTTQHFLCSQDRDLPNKEKICEIYLPLL